LKRHPLLTVSLLLVSIVAGAGFVGIGNPSLVDWRRARVVVIESDDWGLCGFVPRATALTPSQRRQLDAGRIPPGYWTSTLEDSADVADVAALLAARRGRDDQPAVLQPNYILGAWALAEDGGWRRYLLPDLPPAYRRDGLWRAVADARRAGVWRPELHGLWHYDPQARRSALAADATAAVLARRGVLPFPGINRAWELGPDRPPEVVAGELTLALAVFARLFDRPPAAVIAPDYVWDRRHEVLWRDAGLEAVQAKREQRRPAWGGGPVARGRKLLERCWRRLSERRLVYLERNARLEPVQEADPAGTVAACVAAVRRAWERGEPAVVECHRFNLVNTDAQAQATGRWALGAVLDSLVGDRKRAPLFLTDAEVARLARGGASARRRGREWLVRNLAHGLRPVVMQDGEGPAMVVFVPGLCDGRAVSSPGTRSERH